MLDKAIDDLELIYERIDSEGEWIDASDISLDSVELAIGALKALRQLQAYDGTDDTTILYNLKTILDSEKN